MNQIKGIEMNEGKYKGKLVTYGFLAGEKDQMTGQEKPPQFFGTFEFLDENQANQKQTWFGGFKELQAGKKTSQREITLKTIKTLGYKGTQIAQLAAGVESGLLDTEKLFEIELEHQKDITGSVRCNENGEPYFRIKWVNDPENSGFKNLMNPQDALVKIGGLNLDAEMLALGGGNAAPAGYQQMPPQQPVQQQNYQQPPAQPVYNQAPPQNVQPNNQPPQNVQHAVPQNNQQQMPPQNNQMPNQQNMGFSQGGTPPF